MVLFVQYHYVPCVCVCVCVRACVCVSTIKISDYSLVQFLPLNMAEEDSISDLMLYIDNTIQYGEDLDVKVPKVCTLPSTTRLLRTECVLFCSWRPMKIKDTLHMYDLTPPTNCFLVSQITRKKIAKRIISHWMQKGCI